MNKSKVIRYYFTALYTVYIFIIIAFIQDNNFLYSDNWLSNINKIIVLTIIIQIILIKVMGLRYLSLPVIFIAFSYLFHLSQQYLYYINYDFGIYGQLVKASRYGIIYNQVVHFSLISIMFVYLGYILCGSNTTVVKPNYDKILIESKGTPYFGILLVILGLLFDLNILYNRIIAMSMGGYTGVHEVQYGLLQEYMSYMLPIGSFYLLFHYKNDKKKSRLIVFLITIYQVIGMVTGLRAYATLTIIIVLYIYLRYIDKVKISKIVVLALLGIFFLNMLSYISQVRDRGINAEEVIVNMFTNYSGILNKICFEFGYTINVVASAFSQVKEIAYGKSLLCSLVYVIPFNAKIFGADFVTNYYTLYSLNQWTTGSSYISDFYYDFGYGAVVLCFIYGIVITKLSNRLDKYIQKNDIFNASYIVFIYIDILYSVRSYVFRFPRKFIYTYVLYCLLHWIYKKVKIKNKRRPEELLSDSDNT